MASGETSGGFLHILIPSRHIQIFELFLGPLAIFWRKFVTIYLVLLNWRNYVVPKSRSLHSIGSITRIRHWACQTVRDVEADCNYQEL